MQIIIIGIVFYFLGRAIVHDWQAIKDFDWSFDLPWLLVSLVMLSVTYSGHAIGWLLVLWRFQHPVPFLPGFYVWSKSLLARYVPGNVLMIVGRIMMIERYNVPKRVSLTSIAYEQIILVTSATIVLSVALPFWTTLREATDFVWIILVIPPLAIICLHPKVIGTLGNFVFTKLKREPIEQFLSFGSVLMLTLYYCTFWFTGGSALFAMAKAVTPHVTIDALPVCLVSFPLAWLVSVAAFIFPSGLGIREGVYATTLAGVFGSEGVASAFAILARFWWIIIELTFVVIIMSLVKMLHQKPEP